MFEVAIYSFIVHISLYGIFRFIIIPTVLKLFNYRGMNAYEYFKTKITPHEQQHHAQVLMCMFHAILTTYGAHASFLPFHFNRPDYFANKSTLEMYETIIVELCDHNPEHVLLQGGQALVSLRCFWLEYV